MRRRCQHLPRRRHHLLGVLRLPHLAVGTLPMDDRTLLADGRLRLERLRRLPLLARSPARAAPAAPHPGLPLPRRDDRGLPLPHQSRAPLLPPLVRHLAWHRLCPVHHEPPHRLLATQPPARRRTQHTQPRPHRQPRHLPRSLPLHPPRPAGGLCRAANPPA